MATPTARRRRREEKRLAALPAWRRYLLRAPVQRLAWAAGVGVVLGAAVWLLASHGAGGEKARIIDPVRNERTAGLGVLAAEGQLAPNFETTDFSGQRVRLSDYLGKVVLVNFYASWCTACREEIPAYQRVYDRYRDQGFEILAVNYGQSAGVAESYLRANGGRFRGLLDPDRTIGDAYRIRGGLPVSVFIDRDGVVLKYVAGEMSEAAADRLVKAFVATSPPGSSRPQAPASPSAAADHGEWTGAEAGRRP